MPEPESVQVKTAGKSEPQPLILWIAAGTLFALSLAQVIVAGRQNFRLSELSEPVQFYLYGYRQPSDIVAQPVYKDRIVGYVSVPKQQRDRGAQASSRGRPPKPL